MNNNSRCYGSHQDNSPNHRSWDDDLGFNSVTDSVIVPVAEVAEIDLRQKPERNMSDILSLGISHTEYATVTRVCIAFVSGYHMHECWLLLIVFAI